MTGRTRGRLRLAASRAALVVALSCGCRDAVPPSEQAAPAPRPAAALAPLAAQRARLDALRAAPPDARFVSAVAALHHFVTGWQVVLPDLERTADGTRVRYYGKEVGTLRDGATFADAVAMLTGFARTLGVSKAAADVGPLGDLLFDDEAIDTLTRVQSESAAGKRNVRDAARALFGLALGECDDLGMADEASSRALAALALARANGIDVERELALLTGHFGYEKEAEKRAEKLPESDVARAFLLGDDATLARTGSTLARFLELIRLERKGDAEGVASLAARTLGRRALGPAVLSMRMCAGDERAPPALLARTLLDAALDAGVTVASKAKADLEGARDLTRLTPIVYGWLGIQRAEGLGRFENDVERAGAHDRGPYLDRSLRQHLLRARAANAIRRIGARIAREKPLEEAHAAFANEVPEGATSELGSALHAWHVALVRARHGFVVALPTGALGPLATLDVAETALAGLPADVPEDELDARAAARWALARLDARGFHRTLAAKLAQLVLLDPTLARSASVAAAGTASLTAARGPAIGLERPLLVDVAEEPLLLARSIAALGPVRPRVIAEIGRRMAASKSDHASFARALSDAGASPAARRAIALGALAREGAAIAAAILPALAEQTKSPLARLDLTEDAAGAIAMVQGEAAANAYRAAHAIGDAAAFAAPIFYAHHRSIPIPSGPREAAELALLLSIAHRATLRDPASVRPSGDTRFAAIARHLVGEEDLATALGRPTSAEERCELAYYLAIAADAAGRDADVDTWLQTALDEGHPDVAEWRWAALLARSRLP